MDVFCPSLFSHSAIFLLACLISECCLVAVRLVVSHLELEFRMTAQTCSRSMLTAAMLADEWAIDGLLVEEYAAALPAAAAVHYVIDKWVGVLGLVFLVDGVWAFVECEY